MKRRAVEPRAELPWSFAAIDSYVLGPVTRDWGVRRGFAGRAAVSKAGEAPPPRSDEPGLRRARVHLVRRYVGVGSSCALFEEKRLFPGKQLLPVGVPPLL